MLSIKKLLLLLVFLGNVSAQNLSPDFKQSILDVVSKDYAINMGGAGLIELDKKVFLVGVGRVPITGQSELVMKRLGKIKAQNEFIKYCKAPTITTEKRFILEEMIDGDEYEMKETFYQYIAENSVAFIRGTMDIGFFIDPYGEMLLYVVLKEVKL